VEQSRENRIHITSNQVSGASVVFLIIILLNMNIHVEKQLTSTHILHLLQRFTQNGSIKYQTRKHKTVRLSEANRRKYLGSELG
jgi:hypothetical protein